MNVDKDTARQLVQEFAVAEMKESVAELKKHVLSLIRSKLALLPVPEHRPDGPPDPIYTPGWCEYVRYIKYLWPDGKISAMGGSDRTGILDPDCIDDMPLESLLDLLESLNNK